MKKLILLILAVIFLTSATDTDVSDYSTQMSVSNLVFNYKKSKTSEFVHVSNGKFNESYVYKPEFESSAFITYNRLISTSFADGCDLKHTEAYYWPSKGWFDYTKYRNIVSNAINSDGYLFQPDFSYGSRLMVWKKNNEYIVGYLSKPNINSYLFNVCRVK